MLEWGNEACERLFECSAKVFAEDASAQVWKFHFFCKFSFLNV